MGSPLPDTYGPGAQPGGVRAAAARARRLAVSATPARARLSARGQRSLQAILTAAYRQPAARTDITLADRRLLLLRAGLDPAAPVAQVTADQWHRLAVLLGGWKPARPAGSPLS